MTGHTEDCSFQPRDVFRCSQCGRVVCYCQGSDDEWPELCVDCWKEVEG